MKVILHFIYKIIKNETIKELKNAKLKNNWKISFIKIEILQIL